MAGMGCVCSVEVVVKKLHVPEDMVPMGLLWHNRVSGMTVVVPCHENEPDEGRTSALTWWLVEH